MTGTPGLRHIANTRLRPEVLAVALTQRSPPRTNTATVHGGGCRGRRGRRAWEAAGPAVAREERPPTRPGQLDLIAEPGCHGPSPTGQVARRIPSPGWSRARALPARLTQPCPLQIHQPYERIQACLPPQPSLSMAYRDSIGGGPPWALRRPSGCPPCMPRPRLASRLPYVQPFLSDLAVLTSDPRGARPQKGPLAV